MEKRNNPLCRQSLHLIAQFLEDSECRNTMQIFSSEAHYQKENVGESPKLESVMDFISRRRSKVSEGITQENCRVRRTQAKRIRGINAEKLGIFG